MAFKDSVRLEQIYFKNLQTLNASLKSLRKAETKEEIIEILDSCISANDAILLLYKNVGEAWNDTVSLILKTQSELDTLKAEVTAYEGEINEKIDEVNNYLMNLIREIQEQIAVLHQKVDHRVRIVSWDDDKVNRYELTVANSYINETTVPYSLDGGERFIVGSLSNLFADDTISDRVNAVCVKFEALNASPTSSPSYYIKLDAHVTVSYAITDEVDYYVHSLNTGEEKSFTTILEHKRLATNESSNEIVFGQGGVTFTLPCSVGKAKELIGSYDTVTPNPIRVNVDFVAEFIDGTVSDWGTTGEDGFHLIIEALELVDKNPVD